MTRANELWYSSCRNFEARAKLERTTCLFDVFDVREMVDTLFDWRSLAEDHQNEENTNATRRYQIEILV